MFSSKPYSLADITSYDYAAAAARCAVALGLAGDSEAREAAFGCVPLLSSGRVSANDALVKRVGRPLAAGFLKDSAKVARAPPPIPSAPHSAAALRRCQPWAASALVRTAGYI